MSRNKSKYSRDDRKHIVQSIENLKNDEDYVAIFEILTDTTNNSFSQNSNGLFLDMSSVGDGTLDRIVKYLNKVNKKISGANQIDVDVDVIPNQYISKSDRAYKLSNYEKNILKQRNLKKVLNDDNEYEELKFAARKNRKTATTKKANNNKQKQADC